MLAIYADTHATDGHRLEGPALEAARDADLVVHAGDFTTERVHAAFREEAERLVAVHGNADSGTLRERLPETRSVEYEGVRVALTHRRDGGETGLELFGRSRAADLVVSGHSHRPGVTVAGDVTLLNPGSHVQPRGNRPGFATLSPTDEGLSGHLREPDGTTIERFEVTLGGEP
ncbi:metallophosphoesterase [Saliphagus sp. LR7]|uniref:metallophosphoesterase n=1 Tax=Saliphagus sp. LR7 TaxID=2282654 RepID=UPI000DF77941|nr:metallophosphoesterase [Saliphagus sp. LR7]